MRKTYFRSTQKIFATNQKPKKVRLFSNQRLIPRKTMKLLRESTIIKDPDFIWLLDFFTQNPCIKRKEVDFLSPEKQHFFKEIFDRLVQQASAEWKRLDNEDIRDESEGISCELCGKTPIKYVYFIQNKFNETELCVGKECIKAFDIDKNNPINEKHLKEKAKLKRIAYLETIIPGLEHIKNSWRNELESLPMIPPLQLEGQYLRVGDQFSMIYFDFIEDLNSPRDQQYLAQFTELINQRNILLQSMHNYTQTNHSKKYAVTRELISALQRQSVSTQLIESLKSDQGFITEKTISQITDRRFLQSLIPELNQYLKQIAVQIETTETPSIGAVRYKLHLIKRDIYLYITTRNLLTFCGPLLFGKQLQSFSQLGRIIEDSEILDISKRTYAKLLKAALRSYPVDIYIIDESYNEIIIALKTDNPKRYITLDFKEVFKRSKQWILAGEKQSLQIFLDFLTNPKLTKYDHKYIMGLLFNRHGNDKEYIDELKVN